MTKTVVLTDLIVDYIHTDYENQRVLVGYRMIDGEGRKWEGGEAIFWVTMPENPGNNDFLLPSSYIPTLLSLRADADTALTDRFLI